MFQTKQRRFRGRSNGRRHMSNRNGGGQNQTRSNSFSNTQPRNNFRSFQSAEKLFEKYTSLAKEATSAGDKTLSENYLQHADHFMRVIEDKNKNRIQNKTNTAIEEVKEEKTQTINNDLSKEKEIKN
jgi:hypothetical protein